MPALPLPSAECGAASIGSGLAYARSCHCGACPGLDPAAAIQAKPRNDGLPRRALADRTSSTLKPIDAAPRPG